MAKRSYKISDFSGGIRQDIAANNLPANACVECKGFEISEKTGALIRQLGWEELESISDFSGTPVAGMSCVFLEPEANAGGSQEVTFIATHTGTTPRFYMKPYWSGGGGWLSSWYDIGGSYIRDFTKKIWNWSDFAGEWSDWVFQNGVLRVAMGADSRLHYPVWLGFVKRGMFSQLGGAGAFYDNTYATTGYFVCDVGALVAPHCHFYDNVGFGPYYGAAIEMDMTEEFDECDLPYGIYQFALSYVYDGYQEGPIGMEVSGGPEEIETTGGNVIATYSAIGSAATYEMVDETGVYAKWLSPTLTIHVAKDTADNGYWNYRWSAIRVYVKFTPKPKPDDVLDDRWCNFTGIATDWQLLAHIPIDKHLTTNDTEAGCYIMENGWHWGSFPGHTDTGTMLITLKMRGLPSSGITYWDSAGHHCDSPYIVTNYSKMGIAGDNYFVGGVRTYVSDDLEHGKSEYSHAVYHATRQGWCGLIAPDVFPPLNFIPIDSGSGEGTIQSIKELGGNALILQEHSLTSLRASQYGGFAKIKRRFAGVGCIAPQTVVRVGDGIFFADEEGVWYYDGLDCKMISEAIKDIWNDATIDQKKVAFAAYFPQRKQYWLLLTNVFGAQAMVYNLLKGTWFESFIWTDGLAIKDVFAGSDNNIYAMSTTKLYKSSDTDYVLTATWKSGQLDMGSPEIVKRFKDIYVMHETGDMSVTQPYFSVRVDEVAVLTNAPIPASEYIKTVTRFHLDSAKGKKIELQVYHSGDKTKMWEIHEAVVKYDSRKPTSLG